MLLPNASLLETTTTHETLTLPPSHLNPQPSTLLPPPQILLFLTLQLLLTFLPRLYKRYTPQHPQHHQHPSLTQELAALTTALATLRHQTALLEKAISHTPPPYAPSPSPSATQLLQSVSDDGEEYDEFGFPPPLEEGHELMLPSPVVGGHAALGCFYRRGVVYERLRGRKGGDGGGAGGEEGCGG